jgi:hypothetical protein
MVTQAPDGKQQQDEHDRRRQRDKGVRGHAAIEFYVAALAGAVQVKDVRAVKRESKDSNGKGSQQGQ